MHTLGYRFRPWTEAKAIADGASILDYVRETARENGIERKIRFRHRVVRRRVVERARRAGRSRPSATDSGETVRLHLRLPLDLQRLLPLRRGLHARVRRARALRRADRPPAALARGPRLRGQAGGRDRQRRTAVTLVPAMAEEAAHVTMLQRSPTYIVSLPARGPDRRRAAPRAARRARPTRSCAGRTSCCRCSVYQLCRRRPQPVKTTDPQARSAPLPAGYDVDTHFKPRYDPWDQRLCLVPDGDLFRRSATASAAIVTDRIETFTEAGIRLESGRRAGGRRDRHGDRAEPALPRRHASSSSTAARSTCPRRWPTRG